MIASENDSFVREHFDAVDVLIFYKK